MRGTAVHEEHNTRRAPGQLEWGAWVAEENGKKAQGSGAMPCVQKDVPQD